MTTIESVPRVLDKLRKFQLWLTSDDRPPYPRAAYQELLFLTQFDSENYSILVHDTIHSLPTLTDSENWLCLLHDTEYPDRHSFTVEQIECILNRNSFGQYSRDHFCPYPTTSKVIADVDRGFISLAKRWTQNFTGWYPLEHVMEYYEAIEGTTDRVLRNRHYHGQGLAPGMSQGMHIEPTSAPQRELEESKETSS